MSTKFVNIGTATQKDWVVEFKCAATGSKSPEVGDIVKVNGRNVRVTEVLDQVGESMAYGETCKFRFVNF